MRQVAIFLLALAALPAAAQNSPESKAALEKTLRDYIGLYRTETLEEWRKLFHPQLRVVFPDAKGSIVVRNLEQFYGAQASYLPTRKWVSERLEHVRIEEGRRIAFVTSAFVFVDENVESRGKLGLHLVEGSAGWRIVGIIFSYDKEEE
ncbi:MAG: nuclear transport factor 2 family protein [Acidobacteria bacterium]|nr:nuclear transport factor 2 family protein [Acidobacteriota bacterium]